MFVPQFFRCFLILFHCEHQLTRDAPLPSKTTGIQLNRQVGDSSTAPDPRPDPPPLTGREPVLPCPAELMLPSRQSPPPESSSRVHDLLLNPSSPETPLLRPSPLYQENALACLYFFAPLQRSFGWGNIWGRRALAVKWLNVCEGKQPMKK